MLIYDERKNKMVSYTTSGFDHKKAYEIYQNHRILNNKKLEVYTEKDYNHFVVNQSIDEEKNPSLLFNVENTKSKNSFASQSDPTAHIADSSENGQIVSTDSFKSSCAAPPNLNKFSLQITTNDEYKSLFKNSSEP